MVMCNDEREKRENEKRNNGEMCGEREEKDVLMSSNIYIYLSIMKERKERKE